MVAKTMYYEDSSTPLSNSAPRIEGYDYVHFVYIRHEFSFGLSLRQSYEVDRCKRPAGELLDV